MIWFEAENSFQALDLKVGGEGVCVTSEGVNWLRYDSGAKSSARTGQLASDYSLCRETEMEGRPMAPWLSFGGAQLRKKRKEKRNTCGCSDPSTRSGT